jgi:DNA-binding Lrp family transcriptional regulator
MRQRPHSRLRVRRRALHRTLASGWPPTRAAGGSAVPGNAPEKQQDARWLPEVIHTHHITGNYDYLLQVEVADLPAYEDFHANRLATLPSVAGVTSYVTMKTLSPVQTGAPGPSRVARGAHASVPRQGGRSA